jgi:hypothetical protein
MTGVEPEIAAQDTFSCALGSLKWRASICRGGRGDPPSTGRGSAGRVAAAVVDSSSALGDSLAELERWRLRHVDTEQGHAERARVAAESEARRQLFTAEHAAEIALVGYQRVWDEHHRTRVCDGHSWRDGVDAALSDSGAGDDDDW